MKFYLILIYCLLISLSCANEPHDNIQLQEHGVFVFSTDLGDMEDKDELPDYIDPTTVLCFGKGLKVGRCISKQLENEICLGLVKHNKKVIAIEVPCEVMHTDSTSVKATSILTE